MGGHQSSALCPWLIRQVWSLFEERVSNVIHCAHLTERSNESIKSLSQHSGTAISPALSMCNPDKLYLSLRNYMNDGYNGNGAELHFSISLYPLSTLDCDPEWRFNRLVSWAKDNWALYSI